MKILVVVVSWGLVFWAAPLYVTDRAAPFLEWLTSWRHWAGFLLIFIAFELREWLGRRES